MSEKRADVVAWVEMLRPEDYPMTPMPDVASRDLDTVTLELTRAEAEAISTAVCVAQDEMPWSEYEERWRSIAARIAEKLAK